MSGILISVILGLIVNECCDVSPWCARKLIQWAAYRRYTDPCRAADRAEELAALIEGRPGKLLKLFTALGFASTAILIACRRELASKQALKAMPGWSPKDVPARNEGFTGREDLLGAVRGAFLSSDRLVVQALYGVGGVGKTQLANEYAHRYTSDYDFVWWINAERRELIEAQFADLAVALGCAEEGADPAEVRARVLGVLRKRERWLLVFDNADNPEVIAGWLPGGPGHVLVTSRAHGWDAYAVPVEVDVMTREESVALFRGAATLSEADADLVAKALGDLPLALALAASFMVATGIPAVEYVRRLEETMAEILDRRPSLPAEDHPSIQQSASPRVAR